MVGSTGILPTQLSLGGGQDTDLASGISFARLAFSSVKSSVAALSDSRRTAVVERPFINNARSTAPALATFPSRDLGVRLADLYFQNSNPMYPILHRKKFMLLFEQVCASEPCTPRESYILHIVFAIGAGIHLTEVHSDHEGQPTTGRAKEGTSQLQPEEYYLTAISFLDLFLSSTANKRRANGLEELQAVLLLAAFALLRPAAPGLWYIVGVAVRRAVDLGLYSDDLCVQASEDAQDPRQMEVVRDLRRRLWWCAYSFDRLISTSVGRPPSIPDSIIATDFPSLLDDDFISPTGFIDSPDGDQPSYKHVSHHYFRLRLLQSEILQVSQAVQGQRQRNSRVRNVHCHVDPYSPFPQRFATSHSWREDMDRRLSQWRDTAPDERTSGVSFPPEYFELNYWQTIIMLYPLATHMSITDNRITTREEGPWEADTSVQEQDEEFLRTAEAGQAVLRLYRELHLTNLVNYTYLDTHQLFKAGKCCGPLEDRAMREIVQLTVLMIANAFLSAIWLSSAVRQKFSVADIDLTVLAATSVLNDLVEKCPHAEACRNAILKMSTATLKKCRLSRRGPGLLSGQGSRGGQPRKPRDGVIDANFSPSKHTASSSPPLSEVFSASGLHWPQPTAHRQANVGGGTEERVPQHQTRDLNDDQTAHPHHRAPEMVQNMFREDFSTELGFPLGFQGTTRHSTTLSQMAPGPNSNSVPSSFYNSNGPPVRLEWTADDLDLDLDVGAPIDLFDGFFFGDLAES